MIVPVETGRPRTRGSGATTRPVHRSGQHCDALYAVDGLHRLEAIVCRPGEPDVVLAADTQRARPSSPVGRRDHAPRRQRPAVRALERRHRDLRGRAASRAVRSSSAPRSVSRSRARTRPPHPARRRRAGGSAFVTRFVTGEKSASRGRRACRRPRGTRGSTRRRAYSCLISPEMFVADAQRVSASRGAPASSRPRTSPCRTSDHRTQPPCFISSTWMPFSSSQSTSRFASDRSAGRLQRDHVPLRVLAHPDVVGDVRRGAARPPCSVRHAAAVRLELVPEHVVTVRQVEEERPPRHRVLASFAPSRPRWCVVLPARRSRSSSSCTSRPSSR